jgi:hypothetical protein
VLAAGVLERLHDPIAFGSRRIDRYEIVVVQVHAPRADVAEQRHRLGRRQRGPHDVAKRVATPVAHCPEPK